MKKCRLIIGMASLSLASFIGAASVAGTVEATKVNSLVCEYNSKSEVSVVEKAVIEKSILTVSGFEVKDPVSSNIDSESVKETAIILKSNDSNETTQSKDTRVKKIKEDQKKTKKVQKKIQKEKKKITIKKTKTKNKSKNSNMKYVGTFKVTAYCGCSACCGKSNGITASGTHATAGRTIAADSSKFPFGTELVVDGHKYTVEDRGGAINGNKIDVFFNSHHEALNWGVRYCEVYLSK